MGTKTDHLHQAAEFLEQYERHDPKVVEYTPAVYQAYARMLRAEMRDGIPRDALRVLGKAQLGEALENLTINKFLNDRARFCPVLDDLLRRM